MLHLLKVTGSRNEMTTKQMRDEVAENLGLTLPAGTAVKAWFMLGIAQQGQR